MIKGKKENVTRINEKILEKVVNVVTTEQTMLENIDIDSAINMAIEYELDLVEISPSNEKSVSICKIMDYGKFKYEQSKKKNSKKHILKEIKYNLSISDHDLQTKHNQILKFIKKGYTVRYVMQLKGREISRKEYALLKFNGNLNKFDGVVSWDIPKVSGRLISTTLNPN